MPGEPLTDDSVFMVQESVVVDVIAGTVFMCILISSLVYDPGGSSWEGAIFFGLLPAIVFFFKATDRRPAITVSKNGIYFFGNLVTDWNNFRSAKAKQLSQQTPTRSSAGVSDRVILIVEYFKQPSGDLYRQSIPLISTQNKSESEIIAAIEFFYGLSQKGKTIEST